MAYQRPAPTAAELQQGAGYLMYEVLMLSNAAALLEVNRSGFLGGDFY